MNLHGSVHQEVVRKLKSVISAKGMRAFLHHEAIGKGLFNVGFTSAFGPMEAWVSQMTNTEDTTLVPWRFLC